MSLLWGFSALSKDTWTCDQGPNHQSWDLQINYQPLPPKLKAPQFLLLSFCLAHVIIILNN